MAAGRSALLRFGYAKVPGRDGVDTANRCISRHRASVGVVVREPRLAPPNAYREYRGGSPMSMTALADATMQAARIVAPGQVDMVEAPVPIPGPGEARVRLEGCGVCA